MNSKEKSKKGMITVMMVSSMIVGAAGGTFLNAIQSSAQTATAPTTTAATTATTPTVNTDPGGSANTTMPSGAFKSNEDPTHEVTESPAREAQENAGQRPTVK